MAWVGGARGVCFVPPGAAASPALGAPRAHWAALPPGAASCIASSAAISAHWAALPPGTSASHRARGGAPAARASRSGSRRRGPSECGEQYRGRENRHWGREPPTGWGRQIACPDDLLPAPMRPRGRPGPLGRTRTDRRTGRGAAPHSTVRRLCGRPNPQSRVAWFAGAETGPPSAVWGSCADAEIPLPPGGVLVRVL